MLLICYKEKTKVSLNCIATDSTSVNLSKVFTEKTEISSQLCRSNSQNVVPSLPLALPFSLPVRLKAWSQYLPPSISCHTCFHHLIAALSLTSIFSLIAVTPIMVITLPVCKVDFPSTFSIFCPFFLVSLWCVWQSGCRCLSCGGLCVPPWIRLSRQSLIPTPNRSC